MGQNETWRRRIAVVDFGPSKLAVDSDCGVVKLYQDGRCLGALNPTEAYLLADKLADALNDAAESVERASRGGER